MSWSVEALSTAHDREPFTSGSDQLDIYIRKLAGQHARRNLGRTFVAVRPGEQRVLGYYTLASSSVAFRHAPDTLQRKLPRYPIPVALLAKLAVDQSAQGQGLGEFLLMDAVHRVAAISSELAIFAVTVHAIDAKAIRFYERYGFQAFSDHPQHLFLPLSTIRQDT